MKQLIEKFRLSHKWKVSPSLGLPQISDDPIAPNFKISNDLIEFYKLCGGLESLIHRDEDLFVSIVPPNNIEFAPRKLLGRTFERQILVFRKNIAWYWYIVGHGDTDQYFVIDMSPERYGLCYFTQFYFFGQKGFTPIIATSFRGLLEQLYKAVLVGKEWSWAEVGLGDAYD